MKQKNKIWKIALGSIGSLTTISLPIYSLSACANNKAVTNQQTANDTSVNEENRVKYTTVKFVIPAGQDITYEGDLEVTARVGDQFGTLTTPRCSKYGHRFLHWSKTWPADNEVMLTDLVPDPDIENWTLYPIFQDSVTLSQCVGISTIETTTITVTRQPNTDVNLYYTDNYGEDWTMIFDDNAEKDPTPSTLLSVELPTLAPGENIFLRGDNPTGFSKSASQYVNFSFSEGSAINIMGNIMGLIDKASGTVRDIPNEYCFYKLFRAESDETAAIQYISNTFLAIDTLKDHCYQEMFYGCANLINAPWLSTNWHKNPEDPDPEVVPTYCYNKMFYGCDSLTTLRLSYNGSFADDSTTNHCFEDWLYGVAEEGEILFDGTAPTERGDDSIPSDWKIVKSWNPENPEEDPSFTVACTDPAAASASYVYKVDHPYQFKATVDEDHSNRLTWFSSDSEYVDVNPETGVATPLKPTPEGVEVYVVAYSKYSMDWWGAAAVTCENINLNDCLIFESYENNSTVGWEYVGDGGTTNLKYSTDGGVNWIKFWPGPTSAVKLDAGKTLYVKGNNADGLNNPSKAMIEKENAYTHFLIGSSDSTKQGNVRVRGKLMGLLDDGRGEMTTIPSAYCFNHLFFEQNGLTQIDGTNLFNATTLTEGCYYSMFEWCEELKTAMEAPIGDSTTTLSAFSCTRMFYHCPKLEIPPSMPATALEEGCCWRMFEFDSQLKSSPDLPATTAAKSCYRMMFQQCTSLETPGEVLLESLADYACYQMFVSTGFSASTSSWGRTWFIHIPESSGFTSTETFGMFRSQTKPSYDTDYYY